MLITQPRQDMDSRFRSLAKTVSYRFLSTFVTVGIAFAITREITIALGVGAADSLVKLGFYYVHERAWQRVPLGKSINRSRKYFSQTTRFVNSK